MRVSTSNDENLGVDSRLRLPAIHQRISTNMPDIFLTFACRRCKQARCVSGIWWDLRAIQELRDKEFSARCPNCGHKDVFFGIEAVALYYGEPSPLERMEYSEEELREFGLLEDG
jgi:ribosomal protein S27E